MILAFDRVAKILVLVGFNLAGLFEANWRDSEIQRLVLFLLAVPCCVIAKKTHP